MRAKFHSLARVSTLFFHRVGRELSLLFAVYHYELACAASGHSRLIFRAGFPISFSLFRSLPRSHTCAYVRACMRPFTPLFFGTRGERGRRWPTRVSEKQVSDAPRLIERSPEPLIDLPIAATTAFLSR